MVLWGGVCMWIVDMGIYVISISGRGVILVFYYMNQKIEGLIVEKDEFIDIVVVAPTDLMETYDAAWYIFPTAATYAS